MAIHTMNTARIAKQNTLAIKKGICFESLIKKELNVNESIIVSEMGGVWVGNDEVGQLLTENELIDLGNKLAKVLE